MNHNILFSNRMKSNISGMETNMEQLLEKVTVVYVDSFFSQFTNFVEKKENEKRKKREFDRNPCFFPQCR